jgi:NAD(P)-dependent dehydrogenase (short-subunit alcohol dehydrogenase family)
MNSVFPGCFPHICTIQVYISSRSAKDCNSTAEELNVLGPGKCIAIPADLQKIEEVARLVKILSSKEKALHVLVNNAGAVWAAPIDDYPVGNHLLRLVAKFICHFTQDAAFTKVLTLNVQRVFTLTQQVLPLLRAGAAQGGREGSTFKDPARIINASFRLPSGLVWC